MRGTLSGMMHPTRRVGIIPAYAGNTSTAMWASACSRDHPRVCGEHLSGVPRGCVVAGSSPRMRGTPTCFRVDLQSGGIIPAYAGNTCGVVCCRAYVRDHPRVCGEHMPMYSTLVFSTGSSPRMRGTPHFIVLIYLCHGIIPAYAGNTSSSCTYLPSYGDHPRVCGEHTIQAVLRGVRMGSSPRMRGTLHIITVRQDRCGIIPAYAGNTYRSAGSLPWPWDHPRVCGEHHWKGSGQQQGKGSSPRMRGTLADCVGHACPFGIIPAYAGNTTIVPVPHVHWWDHPRVCGEHRSSLIFCK